MKNAVVLEGIVKEIDNVLYTFLVEPEPIALRFSTFPKPLVRVFMVLLMINNESRKMPLIGTKVKLKSPFFNQFGDFITSVVLTKDCYIDGIFSEELPTTPFISIVNLLNLDAKLLLQYAFNLQQLGRNFKFDYGCVFHILLDNLLKCHFDIEFLKNLHFCSDDETSYKYFSYFTLGIHRSPRNTHILGYLCRKSDQTLYLTDSTREIPCIFLNCDNNSKLESFFNSIITISRYIVTTEIYTGEQFFTLEYLMIDLQTTLLQHKEDDIPQTTLPHCETDTKISCTVISKSQITATCSDNLIFWLEVSIENDKTPVFYQMPQPFLKYHNYFDIAGEYTIFHKQKPVPVLDRDVANFARLKYPGRSCPIYAFPADSYFVSQNTTKSVEVLTTSQVLRIISTYTKPLNFEGVILLKIFTDPLPSRTQKLTDNPNFGTPGCKTHKLLFETDSEVQLELYLNNWDNFVSPLGLIPNMRVIFYNVLPQKRKYLKSTSLTSFQIVSYDPQVEFETANLFDQELGRTFYLGAGYFIPTSAIIGGRVNTYEIINLNFQITEGSLNCQITLNVEDEMGNCKLTAKSEGALKLLRGMLGLRERLFEIWLKGFRELMPYSYIRDSSEEEDMQLEFLDKLFSGLNRPFFAKCRKMDNNEKDQIGVYFVLDVQ